jgi:hypothetical protein
VEKDGIVIHEEEELNCNFIQLLKQMRQENLTLDFKKLYGKLQGLTYSYPLLMRNKAKVLKVLIGHLETCGIKALQSGIIELLIALIKDFRSDIY